MCACLEVMRICERPGLAHHDLSCVVLAFSSVDRKSHAIGTKDVEDYITT